MRNFNEGGLVRFLEGLNAAEVKLWRATNADTVAAYKLANVLMADLLYRLDRAAA